MVRSRNIKYIPLLIFFSLIILVILTSCNSDKCSNPVGVPEWVGQYDGGHIGDIY